MFPTVEKLLGDAEGWHVVVLQDHSQSPARMESRQDSLNALKEKYLPLLQANEMRTGVKTLIVLYQTWGYMQPAKNSEKIGDFHTMTRLLAEGYAEYEALLRDVGGMWVVTAPAGKASEIVKEKSLGLWPQLYQPDHFHPKALATFLIGAQIASVIAERFMTLWMKLGLCISFTWPQAAVLYEGDLQPLDADLEAVVRIAGPKVHAVSTQAASFVSLIKTRKTKVKRPSSKK